MEEIIESSPYNYLKLPHFFVFYILIYVIGQKLFQNWDIKHRYEACSCFLSLFHGTPSVILALSALVPMKNTLNPENPSIFSAKNSNLQNLVLDFSSGYFIMDLLHYIVFKPDDVLFIAHHLGTLFVLLTCRFVANHGAFAILVILFLAEVTSACQNVWCLATLRKNDSCVAAKLYGLLVPGFYVFYTIVRGFIAPFFVIKMGFVFVNGVVDGVIPTWVWCSWLLVTISGIFASVLWILSHWVVFYKEKIAKHEKLS